MRQLPRLRDLSLSDFKLGYDLDRYRMPTDQDATVGSLIYQHLSSRPGFIQHKRSAPRSPAQAELYQKAIHRVVAKGAPLEIFIAAFSPKITNPLITNGMRYPDMGDLLSLIHLHLVAKGIREVYDYGFRFIIGYRGFVYQSFFQWPDSVVQGTLDRLLELQQIAESLVGVRHVVRFVDAQQLIQAQGPSFSRRLDDEIVRTAKAYAQGDALCVKKINAWLRDFRRAFDADSFPSPEAADQHLLEHAFYHRALRNIEFTGGPYNRGICNDFPNILLATIRGIDEKMSIQLSPFFRFHAHQRLITLSKNGEWSTMEWQHMQQKDRAFAPVFFKEFEHPFYYEEQ